MTQGSVLLRLAVTSVRGKQAALAKLLGVEQSTVSRWVNGERSPERREAVRLQSEFGIPIESWDEPADPVTPPKDAA